MGLILSWDTIKRVLLGSGCTGSSISGSWKSPGNLLGWICRLFTLIEPLKHYNYMYKEMTSREILMHIRVWILSVCNWTCDDELWPMLITVLSFLLIYENDTASYKSSPGAPIKFQEIFSISRSCRHPVGWVTVCRKVNHLSITNTKINSTQGSYRSSVAKFPDFSCPGMTISLTLSKQ